MHYIPGKSGLMVFISFMLIKLVISKQQTLTKLEKLTIHLKNLVL